MATFSKHLATNLKVISTIQSFFFHFLKASQVPFYRQMENAYTLSLSFLSLCLRLQP
jgi:hypothetical protein